MGANKDQKSKDKLINKSFGQLLSAMLHIVTVSSLNREDSVNIQLPQTWDYLKMISWFVCLTVLSAAIASLGSYLILLSAQLLLASLSIATYGLLQQLILLKFSAELLVPMLTFLFNWFKQKSDSLIVYQVRQFMIRYSHEARDANAFATAWRDRIPAIVGHISASINFVVFVVIYGAYALGHLSLIQLTLAILLGMVGVVFNKGISCRFDVANKEEILTSGRASAEASRLLGPMRNRIWQSGTINSLHRLMKDLNNNMYKATINKYYYSGLLELSAKVIKSITENVFLLYFAFLISRQVITPIEVLILLPYIEKIADSSGNMILITKLSSMISSHISSLLKVWDEIVPEQLQIKQVEVVDRTISFRQMMLYSILVVGLLPILLPILTQVTFQAIAVLLTFWPLVAKWKPNILLSDLFYGLITTLDLPFKTITLDTSVRSEQSRVMVHSENSEPEVEEELKQQSAPSRKLSQPRHHKRTFEGVLQQDVKYDGKLYQVSFNLQQFEGAPVIQAMAPNQRGKTRLFVLKAMENIEGARCFTQDVGVVASNKGYIDAIIEMYGLNEESKTWLLAKVQLLLGFQQRTPNDHPSAGAKEVINVLAGVVSAKCNHCPYICLDEALNSCALDLRRQVYGVVMDFVFCGDKNTFSTECKMLIIDHGLDIRDLKETRDIKLPTRKVCLLHNNQFKTIKSNRRYPQATGARFSQSAISQLLNIQRQSPQCS